MSAGREEISAERRRLHRASPRHVVQYGHAPVSGLPRQPSIRTSFDPIASSPVVHAESLPAFSYDDAFSRNIGWVTRDEQQVLRGKRVAIAGLGGVGGSHLVTLARLGVGKFSIADFDRFGLANFNRQAGASMSTIGEPKVDVLARMAHDIDPEIELRCFAEGVTAENLDEFLRDVDLYVDGLDFFAFDARKAVFDACAKRGIPAVTVAPIGMGAALLSFLPGRMSFEEYFLSLIHI